MSFLLQTLEALLNPPGFVWFVLILLAGVSWRRKERGRFITFAVCAFLLWLGGATPLPAHLLARIETPFVDATLDNAPSADVVLVLGGIASSPAPEPYGFTFGSGAGRFVTGIEALRSGKAKTLVFGGGPRKAGTNTVPEGVLLSRLVRGWDLVGSPVISMRASLTTREEALHFRVLLAQHQWTNVLLVTSAYHMERALATFRHEGIQATPVATDFLGLRALNSANARFRLVPQSPVFRDLSIFVHEALGNIYYRIRGWTARDGPSAPADRR